MSSQISNPSKSTPQLFDVIVGNPPYLKESIEEFAQILDNCNWNKNINRKSIELDEESKNLKNVTVANYSNIEKFLEIPETELDAIFSKIKGKMLHGSSYLPKNKIEQETFLVEIRKDASIEKSYLINSKNPFHYYFYHPLLLYIFIPNNRIVDQYTYENMIFIHTIFKIFSKGIYNDTKIFVAKDPNREMTYTADFTYYRGFPAGVYEQKTKAMPYGRPGNMSYWKFRPKLLKDKLYSKYLV